MKRYIKCRIAQSSCGYTTLSTSQVTSCDSTCTSHCTHTYCVALYHCGDRGYRVHRGQLTQVVQTVVSETYVDLQINKYIHVSKQIPRKQILVLASPSSLGGENSTTRHSSSVCNERKQKEHQLPSPLSLLKLYRVSPKEFLKPSSVNPLCKLKDSYSVLYLGHVILAYM